MTRDRNQGLVTALGGAGANGRDRPIFIRPLAVVTDNSQQSGGRITSLIPAARGRCQNGSSWMQYFEGTLTSEGCRLPPTRATRAWVKLSPEGMAPVGAFIRLAPTSWSVSRLLTVRAVSPWRREITSTALARTCSWRICSKSA